MVLPTNLNRFGGKKAKPYYCEVEYIETTGTQYIDTGLSGECRWVGLGQSTSTQNKSQVFISAQGSSGTFVASEVGSSNKYWGVTSYAGGLSTVPTTSKAAFDLTFTSSGTSGKIGSDTINYSHSNTPKNWRLFSISTSLAYPFVGKAFYAKAYQDGVLVRDFIPVLDLDMTPCMYDKVSGRLFYNAGTGDFDAGREIHYVDYIETTGTQYIDCGLTGNQDTSTSITFQNTQVQKQCIVMGSRSSATSNNISTISPAAVSGLLDNVVNDFGDYNTTRQIVALQSFTDKITAYNSKSLRTVYNHATGVTDTVTTTYTGTFTTPTNLYIAFKSSGYASVHYNFIGKLYDCKIWNSGVLARDYLPAIDENGVGFMFDKVQHRIYDNEGTGIFQYPDVELEYLESTGTQYINTGVIAKSLNGSKLEIYAAYRGGNTVGCLYGACTDKIFYQLNKTTKDNEFRLITNSGDKYYTKSDEFVEQKHKYTVNGNVLYIDDEQILTGTGQKSTGLNLFLFARNYRGQYAHQQGNWRIYSCKIQDGNTLLRNFSAILRNGTAGFLDSVNNVFYQNQGTGTFLYKITEKR